MKYGIELLKESDATGEDWALYRVTVPFDGNWWFVLEINATFIGNRIDLTKPYSISIR